LLLLFPLGKSRFPKRLNHLEGDTKVETAIAKHASHDLCNYLYWGDRLLEIQKTYDASKKVGFKHLWHDRRYVSQWAMMWMALLIATLTLSFQVIQMVLSIWQAASYRSGTYTLHTQL
jgi:hypothetical protein